MSRKTNKALVCRFYEEIDKGNLGVLDEVVAEDYLDHNHSNLSSHTLLSYGKYLPTSASPVPLQPSAP
jgi:hypothetical protein